MHVLWVIRWSMEHMRSNQEAFDPTESPSDVQYETTKRAMTKVLEAPSNVFESTGVGAHETQNIPTDEIAHPIFRRSNRAVSDRSMSRCPRTLGTWSLMHQVAPTCKDVSIAQAGK